MFIDTIEALRALYPPVKPRALAKVLHALDPHCLRFIQLAPFVVIGSGSGVHAMDVSPRGGVPGFVQAPDPFTLLIPDASGNNRLDTLENIAETGQVGLLFMIPGVDETLRINGTARLSCLPEHLQRFTHERHAPKLVIEVRVVQAYLHCAKALMRSKLWDASMQVERSRLPTMGEMIRDQTGSAEPAETQEDMLARYANEL